MCILRRVWILQFVISQKCAKIFQIDKKKKTEI